jgi:hypothetical protein
MAFIDWMGAVIRHSEVKSAPFFQRSRRSIRSRGVPRIRPAYSP